MKILYEDVALNAKQNSSFVGNLNQAFADITDLSQEVLNVPKVGTFEKDYYLLDGTFANFPDNPQDYDWGYFSTELSADVDNSLPNPIVITATLSNGYYISTGINILFDTYGDTFATDVNIKWYKDNVLITQQDFNPDSSEYFCQKLVKLYNKVEITFTKMNNPQVYLKIQNIEFGITRIFTDNELIDVEIDLEISPISEELTINTLHFKLQNKKIIPFSFQKKQPVKVFDKSNNLIGTFYIINSKRTSDKQYEISTEDAIGVLDNNVFLGGIYTNKSSETLINEILDNTGFEYTIEDSLKTIQISGYLPITSTRNALSQIAFAIGCVVDTSYSNKINFYTLKQDLKPIQKNQIYFGGEIESKEALTEVQLLEHNYILGNEDIEAFNDVLTVGQHIIQFSEPLHNITVTNSSIVEQHVNYVIVNTATQTNVTVKGKNYIHTTKLLSKKNIDVPQNTPQNLVEVKDATLITKNNSTNILNIIYNYYISREIITQEIVLKDVEIGDKVTTYTEYEDLKTGRVISLEIEGHGELTARAGVRIE